MEKVISTAISFAGLTSPAASLSGELASIIASLGNPGGNTTYEQLTCAGYNPQTRTLEGVIEVKLNAGYSGGLCTTGSTEYVSFFAFFGGAWQALGTAQVNVHDLKAITPGNPVFYAVFRLSNVTSELCNTLTSIPLRAILSWETIPTGPDFVPFWGNVIDTQIQPQIQTEAQGAHPAHRRCGSGGDSEERKSGLGWRLPRQTDRSRGGLQQRRRQSIWRNHRH